MKKLLLEKFFSKEQNRGFVILFTVVLSSIILAITLAVANVLLKEVHFSTSAKNTNEAFFSADTGIECALFNDKSSSNSFVQVGSSGTVDCLNKTTNLTGTYPLWSFIVSKIGSEEKGCAKVTVDKSSLLQTIIISKGYNDGGSEEGSCIQGQNSVERQLEINY